MDRTSVESHQSSMTLISLVVHDPRAIIIAVLIAEG